MRFGDALQFDARSCLLPPSRPPSQSRGQVGVCVRCGSPKRCCKGVHSSSRPLCGLGGFSSLFVHTHTHTQQATSRRIMCVCVCVCKVYAAATLLQSHDPHAGNRSIRNPRDPRPSPRCQRRGMGPLRGRRRRAAAVRLALQRLVCGAWPSNIHTHTS